MKRKFYRSCVAMFLTMVCSFVNDVRLKNKNKSNKFSYWNIE